MIFDADTWIGHFPFQSYPQRTAADLLRRMDKAGIDKALVGTLNGLLYKDVHESNRELAKEVARHRDRLVPCAMLDPNYYGFRRDLKQCREEFGMPVLRLVPDYHGYSLRDRAAADMVAAAHEEGMRVAMISRIVDNRGRHRLDPGRGLSNDDALYLANQFPDASFLMLNFYTPPGNKRWDKPDGYFDIVRFVGKSGARMEEIIQMAGADRCVFGTTLLMRYPSAAKLALDVCDLSKRDREAILWRNLARLIPEMKSSG